MSGITNLAKLCIASHKYIPSKVSLLAWRILQNKVATEDNLSKRGVFSQNLTYCVVGFKGEESASHLFFECPVFASLWYAICKWIGVRSVLHNEGMIILINWLD